ncbi:hypothetical protein Lesp02_29770 [Lentzea sp. NBRC 105346]|nr:hypothetical protein Lesp02_29770 [Lentzea sp. NBRC 105346]
MRSTKVDVTSVAVGVSYLRVSSKRQMDTASDVDRDGNSIATQREHTGAKATAMRVPVVKEFIEPGKSAQSIAKRKVFKELLAYLKEHPEVRYVFIYMRSRAFRNYTDAAITKRQLAEMGVKLISAKEDFGEGIMADAMEAVTDIMNEVQVRLSGQDISTKMLHKAQNGGTNGVAKLGYLNGIKFVEGRRVNTIVKDEERAPFVVMAFELFATGRYPNIVTLQDKLTTAGLRMPRTGKPISEQTLYKLLRDKYYLGNVIYKGIEYENGRHERLISDELFERVQRILDAHSGTGTRQHSHPHYLKGLMRCFRCRRQFTVQRTKNRHGTVYYYFFCMGRQDGECNQPYIPVELMEAAVADHYRRAVWLSTEELSAARLIVDASATDGQALTAALREQLEKRSDKLDAKESYFLDLAAEEGWPKDKLREKIGTLRTERETISRQLEQDGSGLATGRNVLHRALDLLERPEAAYRAGNETVRSLMNKVFFTRLYADGKKAAVLEHALQEPFDGILSAEYRLYSRGDEARSYHRRSLVVDMERATVPCGTGGSDLGVTLADALERFLADKGSSKPAVVEVPGIEPGSSGVSARLLRAQSAMSLLDPTNHAD